MDKKSIFIPVSIIALSLAFSLICLAVFITNGKSRFWIARKMKIGSILISLTAVLNQSCDKPFLGTTCYDPAPQNYFELDSVDYSGVISMNLDAGNKVTGILYDHLGNDYSFNVVDSISNETVQTGDIIPTDGSFDNSTEEIYLTLDTELPTGSYTLNLLYNKDIYQSYILRVSNEN